MSSALSLPSPPSPPRFYFSARCSDVPAWDVARWESQRACNFGVIGNGRLPFLVSRNKNKITSKRLRRWRRASAVFAKGRWRGQISNELGYGDRLGEAPQGGAAEVSQAGPDKPSRCGHGELGEQLKCADGGRVGISGLVVPPHPP